MVGDDVRVASHAEFEPLVRQHGLDFHLLSGNPRAVLSSDDGQAWQKSSSNPLTYMSHLRQVATPLIRQIIIDSLRACQGADAILYSVLGAAPAQSVAEKLRIPAFAAYIQPQTPTRQFANYRFPPAPPWLRRGRGIYNQLTYPLTEELFWLMLRTSINEGRRTLLNLPPLSLAAPLVSKQKRKQFQLYGYSPQVLPKPRDWAAGVYVAGYWFLDRYPGWQPPADLVAFLESGPAPVYVGFGSMNSRRPEETTAVVLRALAQTGQRGILATGWGGLSAATLPITVFPVEDVPHEWLFPQMAAIVHHGGSGTTGAALRAGIPAVISYFFADQPLWGRRVQVLGAGPAPIPHKHLTTECLAAAIQIAVNDPQMRARATALGAKIRAEDGVTQAVAVLHQHLGARYQA